MTLVADLDVYVLEGSPGDQGAAHGARLLDEGVLTHEAVDRYLQQVGKTTRTNPKHLANQAAHWLEHQLTDRFAQEIEGLGRGSGLGTQRAAVWLFADIARASPTSSSGEGDAATDSIVGPLCSSVMLRATARPDAAEGVWIGRNCDWLTAILSRGTAAVLHRNGHRSHQGRHDVLALGIRGDIDVDTGVNSAGLWLHLHTIWAKDEPPRDGRPVLSWLFWAREALETCATLDELDAFIAGTGRDRGVIAIAAEANTGRGAMFECGRGSHTRHAYRPEQHEPHRRGMHATNHPIGRTFDADRRSKSKPGGAVARSCRLRELLDEATPEHLPSDLMELLGDDAVEMDRRPDSLLTKAAGPSPVSTIYSTLWTGGVGARHPFGRVWFAAGGTDGRSAASGMWSELGSL